jgi:integrase
LERQPDDVGTQYATAKSEVSQAEKAEFDHTDDIWTIPGVRAKNGRSHRVPLSPPAKALVERAWLLSLDSDFLFPSPVSTKKGDPGEAAITLTSLNYALRKATRSVDLTDVRRATVPARHYPRHSFEREKREALEMWARHLETLIPCGRLGSAEAADLAIDAD